MGNVLDGKVAVVTGSGQGIGKAIALGLAEEGAKIVTNNRKKGSTGYAIINDQAVTTYSDEHKQYLKEQVALFSGDAETVAEEIKAKGGEAVPFFGDVTEFNVAGKLIQAAVDSFGKIDILVNVAGAFSFASCWEMSEATWDHVCTSKPKGYFNTIRHAAPHMMKQQWGRIINTSALAFTGMINHCNYSAANAGVIGLTKGVAKELYQYGITCNAYTPTAATRASYEVVPMLKEMNKAGKKTPLSVEAADRFKNFPDAASISPLIAYLASDPAAHISGSIFHIWGGEIGIWNEPEITARINKETGWWSTEDLMTQMPEVLLKGYKTIATNKI